MAIFRKMAMLMVHTIDNAKLQPLFKFQQKQIIFHRDINKIQKKTKEISADSLWKTKEIKK